MTKAPSMFRVSDLLMISIPVLTFGMSVAALVWNMTSDVGEAIPAGGWISAISAIAMSSMVVIIFYIQRWGWLRKYQYTVQGVHYFYNDGAEIYLDKDVDSDIRKLLRKWVTWHTTQGETYDVKQQVSKGESLKDCCVLFRKEDHWDHTDPGWWTRKVTGLNYGKYSEVGQGGKAVEHTAHAHELSHSHIRWFKGPLSEEDSHAIMRHVGV